MAEGLYSAISVGAVFVLIGIVFVLAQPSNLWDRIVAFFSNFTLRTVTGTGIFLPAPISPSSHTVVYAALFQFCVGLGILQVLLVSLRLMMNSPIKKTAETIGHLVFWFGTSYLVITYLNNTTTIDKWWVFWAGLLMILGLSLIARAFVLLAVRRK
jgi:hypothetical protein